MGDTHEAVSGESKFWLQCNC